MRILLLKCLVLSKGEEKKVGQRKKNGKLDVARMIQRKKRKIDYNVKIILISR